MKNLKKFLSFLVVASLIFSVTAKTKLTSETSKVKQSVTIESEFDATLIFKRHRSR